MDISTKTGDSRYIAYRRPERIDQWYEGKMRGGLEKSCDVRLTRLVYTKNRGLEILFQV